MHDFAYLMNDARRVQRPIDVEALSWMGSGLFELLDLVAAAERVDFTEPEHVDAARKGLESLFAVYQAFCAEKKERDK